MQLKDKVAIVTGGGRGIGRAIALAFAREGASVVVGARTIPEIEEVAAQISRLGRPALAVKTDVSSVDEVTNLIHQTQKAFGMVHILVNDAGIQGPIGPMVDNDAEAWIESIHINLIGIFLCTKAVLPLMQTQKSGKIINLSGGGATSPRERFSSYSVAKAGVVRLTECLAEEVRDYNIQVNALAPGPCNTRILDEIISSGAKAGAKSMAETKRQLETGGTPLEIPAALAVFLASEKSNGLTGRLISAVYDNWREIGERIPQIMESDVYTLRRIDTYTLRRLNPNWRLPIE